MNFKTNTQQMESGGTAPPSGLVSDRRKPVVDPELDHYLHFLPLGKTSFGVKVLPQSHNNRDIHAVGFLLRVAIVSGGMGVLLSLSQEGHVQLSKGNLIFSQRVRTRTPYLVKRLHRHDADAHRAGFEPAVTLTRFDASLAGIIYRVPFALRAGPLARAPRVPDAAGACNRVVALFEQH